MRNAGMRTFALSLALLVGCVTPPTLDPDAAGEGEGGAIEAGTVISEARPLTGLYALGEVRAFEFVQEGTVIGRSFGRYEGTLEREGVTLHRFASRIELLPPGTKPLRWSSEILFDERGRLVEGFERSIAAELTFRAKPELLAIGKRSGLPEAETDQLGYDGETAVMGYMATLHEELMFATRTLRAGDNEWRLISLSAGRADLWSGKAEQRGDTLVVQTNLGEEIWLEHGRITRVEVPEDKLVVKPMAHPVWPEWDVEGPTTLRYHAAADASFTIRPVELPGQSDDPVLRGELLIPDPAKHGAGPFPGVVFLGGSVETDRYGFAGPPAVDLGYHEIGDALANAGFVVIRYDEPGTGESPEAKVSWARQRNDARRAFRTLLVQPEVDPDRIIAVGHAEGGWRALALAAERPKEIVGVALLATPGRSYRELFSNQPELLASLETGQGLPESLVPMAAWYGEILVEDPDALIFRARVPLWIAQGDKDFEVDPIKDLAALKSSARKHKRSFEVAEYPGLDHLFKPEGGNSNQASYLEIRAVDPTFLAALVGWVSKIAKPAP
ncbi:alpha/beta hydrolase family protein [Nannocystaceae bacterium ST9]